MPILNRTEALECADTEDSGTSLVDAFTQTLHVHMHMITVASLMSDLLDIPNCLSGTV